MTDERFFLTVTDEVKRVAMKYNVDATTLAMVPLPVEEAAEALRAAEDRSFRSLVEAARGELRVLAKPLAYKVERSGDALKAFFVFNGVRVEARLPAELLQRYSLVELDALLSDWLFVRATRGKRNYVAREVKWLRIREDVDAARDMVERFGRVVYALAEALGYSAERTRAEADLLLLMLVYGLPLVQPRMREPDEAMLHVALATVPGVGKTTVGLTYRAMLRWVYFNDPPTDATLVYDARTGSDGPLRNGDGLWLDEVDKWQRKMKTRGQAVADLLMSGMEQGYWSRGAGGEKRREYVRHVPVVFSGNVATRLGEAGSECLKPREWVAAIFEKAVPGVGEPLADRIAVGVTVCKRDTAALVQSAVTKRVAKPSVMRGLVRLMRELYTEAPAPEENPYTARRAKQYRAAYRALMVLLAGLDGSGVSWPGREEVEPLARALVEGVVVA